MFKTILFDVDGTIIDTEYVMTRSLQKTLKEEQDKEVTIEELHFILGIPGKEALKKYANSADEIDYLLEQWGKKILSLSHQASIFPYMEDVFKKLQDTGAKMGLVTSKTKTEMENEFDHFDLNSFFKVIVTASDTVLHKPNPDPVLKAIQLLDADKSETIYIGDSVYDMKSAKASGVKFGLAKWGALDLEAFGEADYIFDTPFDVLKLISHSMSEPE